jgi:hypothetical protein
LAVVQDYLVFLILQVRLAMLAIKALVMCYSLDDTRDGDNQVSSENQSPVDNHASEPLTASVG